MPLLNIKPGVKVKFLNKTRIITGYGYGGGGGPTSAFWSGWANEPTYTFTGTATFYTEGNVINLTPRSDLTTFDSSSTFGAPPIGGSVDVRNCTNLTNFTCAIWGITDIQLSGCTALTLLELSYNELTTIDISGCTNLTYIGSYANQLTETAVNNLLINLVTFGNSMGFVDLRGGNAAPTGAGLTAKAILLSRAWTVETN